MMFLDENKLNISNSSVTNPSVSILTIIQFKRTPIFDILVDIVKNQIYDNIIEWIIIEVSQTLDNKQQNESNINNATSNMNISIKYYNILDENNDNSIDELKKLAYEKSSGDICIWMNDDDYYVDSYVRYCVSKLCTLNKSVALCNIIYTYDCLLNSAYKISYNTVLACKKEVKYLVDTQNTNYVILVSDYLFVKILHSTNTNFNRNQYLFNIIQNNNYNLSVEVINHIIPEKYFNVYKKEFYYTNGTYDITYLCGGQPITWSPLDNNLGGSEKAVVLLSTEWSLKGKTVAVYGNFDKKYNINNVEYIPWIYLSFNDIFPTIIAWRRYGILLLKSFNFNCNNILLDFHDNFFTISDLDKNVLSNIFNKVNYFCFKSNYHKNCFNNFIENLNIKIDNMKNKYKIINNGVEKNIFLSDTIPITNFNNCNMVRNPYRFCYCSSYDRGLEVILKTIWPIIYNNNPLCELHVYYGMDYIFNNNYKIYMKTLLGSDGVMDHGRQSIDMIYREKCLSTFHLYINDCICEIDCINIKESAAVGCIPLISNFGVYTERDGVHFDFISNNEENHKSIAYDIIKLMNDPNKINSIRNDIVTSNTIIEWDKIASNWLELTE